MTLTERVLALIFGVVLVVSTVIMLGRLNTMISVEIPAQGGSIKEGVIGFPRFINPLLAATDADKDLTQLMFSGLMKATPEGTLIPDLAESYTISDDGLVYTFTLKDSIFFHDGAAITADDVIFTIEKTQDPIIKSNKRPNWTNVTVSKIGPKEVQFTLTQPYSPFLENTTLGILPKHIWENIDSEQFFFSPFNMEPIGSGPYRLKNIKRDSSGIPELYILRPFEEYASGRAFISEIFVQFYSNEETLIDALIEGEIGGINSISADKASGLADQGFRVESYPLPRIFGIFFNQNNASAFTDQRTRIALDIIIDKEQIVEEILGNYGSVIDSPIPPGSLISSKIENTSSVDELRESSTTTEDRLTAARALLSRAGWEYNESTGFLEKDDDDEVTRLSISLSTSNAPELKAVAEMVARSWRDLGVDLEVKYFEIGNLNQDVIRPREYDALLFGEILGRDLDLFAFWHSSQRNDPGLNIALYANITADALLEDTRTESDIEKRIESYAMFDKEIQNDRPAIFLYSPEFIYVVPSIVKGFESGIVSSPSERFLNVDTWYTDTQRVWTIFE